MISLAQSALIAAVYFAACRLGLWINVTAGVSAVWPASGLLVGVCLLPRRPSVRVVMAGALVGGVAANVFSGFPLLLSIVYTVINIGETLLGCWLLRRVSPDAVHLRHPEDVFTLTACCAGVSAGVSALVAASVATLVIHVPWWPAMRVWWLADATGIVAITPLVLMLAGPRGEASVAWTAKRVAEAGVCLAALVVLGWWIFLAPHDAQHAVFAMPVPLMPIALWAVLRFGVPGGVAATVVTDTFVVWSVAAGSGPFSATPSLTGRLIAAQFFVAVVSLIFPALAATFEVSRRSARTSRGLALQVELAAEDERARISRELHDDVGQRLVALRLQLQIAQLAGGADAEARGGECMALVDGLLADVRSLSRSLRPAPFESGYLVCALTALARAEGKRAGLCVLVDAPADEAVVMPRTHELACYRVVCEAFNNIIKHARARNVALSVQRRPDAVEIRVVDDGQGFEVGAAERTAALAGQLGLLGMKERIEQIQGSLTIRSTRGGGTTVECRIPQEAAA